MVCDARPAGAGTDAFAAGEIAVREFGADAPAVCELAEALEVEMCAAVGDGGAGWGFG